MASGAVSDPAPAEAIPNGDMKNDFTRGANEKPVVDLYWADGAQKTGFPRLPLRVHAE